MGNYGQNYGNFLRGNMKAFGFVVTYIWWNRGRSVTCIRSFRCNQNLLFSTLLFCRLRSDVPKSLCTRSDGGHLSGTSRWQYCPKSSAIIPSLSFYLTGQKRMTARVKKKKKLQTVNPERWHVFLSICLNISPLGPDIRTAESVSRVGLFSIVMEGGEEKRQWGKKTDEKKTKNPQKKEKKNVTLSWSGEQAVRVRWVTKGQRTPTTVSLCYPSHVHWYLLHFLNRSDLPARAARSTKHKAALKE